MDSEGGAQESGGGNGSVEAGGEADAMAVDDPQDKPRK
jgi:hypothetical protein